MKAGWLWEAARSGLGRSPPAGVCRLSDSSALVYHTAAAAAAWREGGREGVLSWQKRTLAVHLALYKNHSLCFN